MCGTTSKLALSSSATSWLLQLFTETETSMINGFPCMRNGNFMDTWKISCVLETSLFHTRNSKIYERSEGKIRVTAPKFWSIPLEIFRIDSLMPCFCLLTNSEPKISNQLFRQFRTGVCHLGKLLSLARTRRDLLLTGSFFFNLKTWVLYRCTIAERAPVGANNQFSILVLLSLF